MRLVEATARGAPSHARRAAAASHRGRRGMRSAGDACVSRISFTAAFRLLRSYWCERLRQGAPATRSEGRRDKGEAGERWAHR